MTKVTELKAGQGNVEAEGIVKEIGEKRTFNKFGRNLTVVNAILEDNSGTIKLSLWNDDAERFKEGDKIKVINGYVNEFQGEKQLTSGKFGKIEKVGEGHSHAHSETEKPKIEKVKEEIENDDMPEEEIKDDESIEDY